MDDKNIPSEYRPISAWGYWGYNLLFSIPIIGVIFLIIYAFDSSNINRRNYARSFFVGILLTVLATLILGIFGVGVATIFSR